MSSVTRQTTDGHPTARRKPSWALFVLVVGFLAVCATAVQDGMVLEFAGKALLILAAVVAAPDLLRLTNLTGGVKRLDWKTGSTFTRVAWGLAVLLVFIVLLDVICDTSQGTPRTFYIVALAAALIGTIVLSLAWFVNSLEDLATEKRSARISDILFSSGTAAGLFIAGNALDLIPLF